MKTNCINKNNYHTIIAIMGRKRTKKLIGNLNQKEALTEPNLQKLTKAELIDIVNKLLSKTNRLENKFDKFEKTVETFKQDFMKQDEITA